MNYTLTLLLVFASISAIAQKKDTTELSRQNLPYYIITCTDKMTDISHAQNSKILICSNDNKKGFAIGINWDFSDGKNIYFNGLIVKSFGIGQCVENSKLFILFEDDTKIQLKASNEFNCIGNSHMDDGGSSFDTLTSKKVKAIRFQNGRTNEYFIYDLKKREQSYFIEVASAQKEKRIISGDCNF